MKNYFSFIFILFTALNYVNGQTVTWADLLDFSADADEMGNDISMDASNNAYVVGYADGGPSYDALAVKYDVTTGDTVWATLHDVSTGSFDLIYGSTLYSQGNLFSTGYTEDITNDILLIKYDNATGVVLWDKTYDFGGNDMGMECDIDDSNNVFIAVQSDMKIGYIKCKVSNGDTLKTHLIDFPLNADANVYGIICGGLNEIYLTGYFEESVNSYKIFVMKYDILNDSILYLYESNHSIDNLAVAISGISLDSDKSIYCSGNAGEFAGVKYGAAFKLDSLGNMIWDKTYENVNDGFYKNTLTQDGFLYACGTSYTGISDDYLLVKYDIGTGDSISAVTVNSGAGADDYAYGIGACTDNNIILTGSADWDEIFTIKIEAVTLGIEEQKSKSVETLQESWFNSISYLSGSKDVIMIEIIDLSGRTLLNRSFLGSINGERFKELSAGKYIVKIISCDKIIYGKFTKF